jgi:hypothetical protein
VSYPRGTLVTETDSQVVAAEVRPVPSRLEEPGADTATEGQRTGGTNMTQLTFLCLKHYPYLEQNSHSYAVDVFLRYKPRTCGHCVVQCMYRSHAVAALGTVAALSTVACDPQPCTVGTPRDRAGRFLGSLKARAIGDMSTAEPTGQIDCWE